jgi:hypothetical protein
MGIWIEIRCENSGNQSSNAKPGSWDERCWSHDNAGPMGMSSDTQASAIELLRNLERRGRAEGWKKTQYGWICPHCDAQPTARNELAAEAAALV